MNLIAVLPQSLNKSAGSVREGAVTMVDITQRALQLQVGDGDFTDVLGKSLGSNNHANVVKATLKALTLLRSRDQVMTLRGKNKQKAI